MAATLEIDPIGEVAPLLLDAELLTVEAPRPLPPGTRVTIREPKADAPLALGKVVSIGKGPRSSEGCLLRVRLFAPEKSARARLETLVPRK